MGLIVVVTKCRDFIGRYKSFKLLCRSAQDLLHLNSVSRCIGKKSSARMGYSILKSRKGMVETFFLYPLIVFSSESAQFVNLVCL